MPPRKPAIFVGVFRQMRSRQNWNEWLIGRPSSEMDLSGQDSEAFEWLCSALAARVRWPQAAELCGESSRSLAARGTVRLVAEQLGIDVRSMTWRETGLVVESLPRALQLRGVADAVGIRRDLLSALCFMGLSSELRRTA